MIRPIATVGDLDAALKAPGPLWVMKHSSTCPASASAWGEFQKAAREAPKAAYAVLVVQEARDVADEITRRFGIRHESPQVILFQAGRPLADLDHEEVTADRMKALLQG